MKRLVYPILSILFIASALLMPLAMTNCGLNGFHLGLRTANSLCGSGNDFGHLTYMRNFFFIGLMTAFFVFVLVLGLGKIISRFYDSANNNFYRLNKRFKEQSSLGRMKPFDQLLLAYAAGLIQPKAFCRT